MNALLEQYVRMVVFLGETLPNTYEILLFDLTQKSMPVVAQCNARHNAAEPVRRCLKTMLNNKTIVDNGMLTNRGDVMQRERVDKTSILLIKDEDGMPAGALALSVDLTALLPLYGTIQDLMKFSSEEIEEIGPRQKAAVSPQEPTLDMINRMLSEFTDQPERLTTDEKTEFLIDLYDTGVFELKGAVSRAAIALGMSQQSVYRYLAKIRNIRGE